MDKYQGEFRPRGYSHKLYKAIFSLKPPTQTPSRAFYGEKKRLTGAIFTPENVNIQTNDSIRVKN